MKKLKCVLKAFKKQTKTCIECFTSYKSKSLRNIMSPSSTICDKCFHNFSIKFYRFKVDGMSCLSLYDYDDYFKSRLFQFKGCYDVVLAKSFIDNFIDEIRLLFYGYTLIPIPSNESDDEERGFNHVKEIFKFLDMKMIDAFVKNKLYKQSDQTLKGREEIKNVLTFIDKVDIVDKKILLVDDVITSGNTIKTCINLLKSKGIKNIKILTLSASKHLDKNDANMFKKAWHKIKMLFEKLN